jgi:hypothetical protein
VLVEDNVDETLRADIDLALEGLPFPVTRERTSYGNGAGSTRRALELALAIETSADPVVYFVEDDFVHLPKALETIHDGAQIFDFATGYDHPDKYHPSHPLVQKLRSGCYESGSSTLLGRTSHFRLTTSTVMTFACRLSVLRECHSLMLPFLSGDYPHDNLMFWNLYGVHGRTLGSALPAVCTHGETAWLAPMPQTGLDAETFWGRVTLRDPDYSAPSRSPPGSEAVPSAAAIVQDLGRPDPSGEPDEEGAHPDPSPPNQQPGPTPSEATPSDI